MLGFRTIHIFIAAILVISINAPPPINPPPPPPPVAAARQAASAPQSIASSEECKQDVELLCSKQTESDWTVMECLQVTGLKCINYLNRVAAFIFADFRLIYKFVDSCQQDIAKYECGRLAVGPSSPKEEAEHLAVKSQGKTIECLRARIEKLQDSCRTQILRVAELQSDDYHLDRPFYYACREDRERLCSKIKAGRGMVFSCLTDHKDDELMSPECNAMILERQRLRSVDFLIDFRLNEACAADMTQSRCTPGGILKSDLSLSKLLLCLESVEKQQTNEKNELIVPGRIRPECKGELLKIRRELLNDYRLSPDLLTHCNSAIETHCASKKNGRGAVLHCLLHQLRSYTRDRPTKQCEQAVHTLVKATDVEENALLDPVIDRSCHSILTTKCAGLEDKGHGAVFECLTANQQDPAMSKACRTHLMELFYFVSRDIMLDDQVHIKCAEDSIRLCNLPHTSWSDNLPADARLLTCLYNHRRGRHPAPLTIKDDIHGNTTGTLSASCNQEVMRMVHLRAASVSLDPRVFEVCLADLASCDEEDDSRYYEDEADEDSEDDEDYDIQENPGQRRVQKPKKVPSSKRKGSAGMACLQDRLEKLQPDCRAAVIEATAEVQEDPDLDKMMARACKPAEVRFCAQTADPGQIFDCMVHHKNHPQMEKGCRAAVEHLQIVAMKDFRISTQFRTSCMTDVARYCQSATDRGTAAVVICLSAQLTAFRVLDSTLTQLNHTQPLTSPLSPECEKELVEQLYERSETIKLDPELVEACGTDVAQFCPKIKPGDGRVHRCLSMHRNKLSSKCHAKLFERDEMAAKDNRVDYALFKACMPMIRAHCEPVITGMGRMKGKIDEKTGKHMIIECLMGAMDRNEAEFDRSCQKHLVHVMRLRTQDYRLDPELQTVCRNDITEHCRPEAESTRLRPYENNSPVLHCLRKHFNEQQREGEMLSPRCYRRVSQLLRWEYAQFHLDPVLAGACKSDMLKQCSHILPKKSGSGGSNDLDDEDEDDYDGDGKEDNVNGRMRDCLQQALHARKLESKECIQEIVLVVDQVRSDLHLDPVLYGACALDVQRLCGQIAPGQGRQMHCLIAALKNPTAEDSLSINCHKQMNKRLELWQYVSSMDEPETIGAFVQQMGSSKLRNYLLMTVFLFLTVVFVVGMCCGRVSKRVPMDVKTR